MCQKCLVRDIGSTNLKYKLFSDCPVGWMRGTGQRKCYKLFGELPSSYSEAQFHCQQELASLINIESKEENDFLEELLNKALQEGKLEDRDIPSVWLGAQRKDA